MNDNVGLYIVELEALTSILVKGIEKVNAEELAAFSEHREQLILLIQKNKMELTELNKQRLMELSRFDDAILSRMTHFKNEANEWLSKQSSIKGQKNAYIANYASDSIFFDQKN